MILFPFVNKNKRKKETIANRSVWDNPRPDANPNKRSVLSITSGIKASIIIAKRLNAKFFFR